MDTNHSSGESIGDRANEAVGLKAYLDGVQARLKTIPAAWVRCELHALKHTGKFIRTEFIEHDSDGKKIAQANGGCWPGVWERINSAFDAVGLRLEPGAKVLVKITSRLDANFGYSIEVQDIDPSYSLGDLKAKAEAIRKRLKAAGIWEGNRSLPQPGDFLRVAVISPAGAAGLGDFRSTVDRLARADLVEFVFHEAPFQKPEAPAEIVMVMREVFKQHRVAPYCALAIIRGGGASADLAYLVDEKLADAVCKMPMPVMTGIGHERDRNLLDEVACIPLDTPSKVAAHIRSAVAGSAQAAGRAWTEIQLHARLTAAHYTKGVTATETTIGRNVRDGLLTAEREVRNALENLKPDARASLKSAQDAVDRAEGGAFTAARSAVRAATETVDKAGTAAVTNARIRRDRARDGLAEMRKDIARLVGQFLLVHERFVSHALANATADSPRLLDTAKREVENDLAAVLHSAWTIVTSVERDVANQVVAALRSANSILDTAEREVESALTLAEALDPRTVLAAGYAILRGPDGAPIPSAALVSAATMIRGEMRDGTVTLKPEAFIPKGADTITASRASEAEQRRTTT